MADSDWRDYDSYIKNVIHDRADEEDWDRANELFDLLGLDDIFTAHRDDDDDSGIREEIEQLMEDNPKLWAEYMDIMNYDDFDDFMADVWYHG